MFVLGCRRELVQGSPADARREARHVRGYQVEERQPVEGSVVAGWFEYGHAGQLFGDGDPACGHVVAARAPEAGRIPVFDDLPVSGGKPDKPPVRPSRRDQAGLLTVHDYRPGHEPFAVGAAAVTRPATVHPERPAGVGDRPPQSARTLRYCRCRGCRRGAWPLRQDPARP